MDSKPEVQPLADPADEFLAGWVQAGGIFPLAIIKVVFRSLMGNFARYWVRELQRPIDLGWCRIEPDGVVVAETRLHQREATLALREAELPLKLAEMEAKLATRAEQHRLDLEAMEAEHKIKRETLVARSLAAQQRLEAEEKVKLTKLFAARLIERQRVEEETRLAELRWKNWRARQGDFNKVPMRVMPRHRRLALGMGRGSSANPGLAPEEGVDRPSSDLVRSLELEENIHSQEVLLCSSTLDTAGAPG